MSIAENIKNYFKVRRLVSEADKQARQIYSSRLGIKCPYVRKKIREHNIERNNQYDPRQNAIIIDKKSIESILNLNGNTYVLTLNLIHEYFHAIKHLLAPYNSDFVYIWGSSVQIEEVAGSFVEAVLMNLTKEQLIIALEELVKTRYAHYEGDYHNIEKWMEYLSKSFSVKGEYIIGYIAALNVYEETEEDKLNRVKFIIQQRDGAAVLKMFGEMTNNIDKLPEDIRKRINWKM